MRAGVPASPRPSRRPARVEPAREFDPGVVTGAGAQTGGMAAPGGDARAAFGVRNRRPAAALRSLRELRFTEYVRLLDDRAVFASYRPSPPTPPDYRRITGPITSPAPPPHPGPHTTPAQSSPPPPTAGPPPPI